MRLHTKLMVSILVLTIALFILPSFQPQNGVQCKKSRALRLLAIALLSLAGRKKKIILPIPIPLPTPIPVNDKKRHYIYKEHIPVPMKHGNSGDPHTIHITGNYGGGGHHVIDAVGNGGSGGYGGGYSGGDSGGGGGGYSTGVSSGGGGSGGGGDQEYASSNGIMSIIPLGIMSNFGPDGVNGGLFGNGLGNLVNGGIYG